MKRSLTQKIIKTGYILFLISLFFPLRYVFLTNEAYKTGAYSDFTSFSLYLCDILAIGLFLLIYKDLKIKKSLKYGLGVLLVWLVVAMTFTSHASLSLNIYFLGRFIELFLVLAVFSTIFTYLKPKTLIKLFLGLASFQAILAISQFLSQKSVGLYLLGESHIGPSIYGVAKIVSYGTKYIRAYGTFPHPNILSAFLVVALFLILFELLRLRAIRPAGSAEPENRQKSQAVTVTYYILLALNLFGLFLTFSRAALLTFGLGLIILAGAYIWRKIGPIRSLILPYAAIILFSLISIVILKNFLITRATFTDEATKERVFYDQVGLKIIQDHPLVGVGEGTSVLHMKQYSPVELQPWEIQPIHNYYLLTAAEIGIVGLIILLILFALPVKDLANQLFREPKRGWPIQPSPKTIRPYFTYHICMFLDINAL